MTRLLPHLLALSMLVTGCAHLGLASDSEREQRELWENAHHNYAEANYEAAANGFQQLVDAHPNTRYGDESLFYLGVVYLDPNNPGWDPKLAQEALDQYLALPPEPYRPEDHQWPEARVLQSLAHQLNMPPAQRVAGLQPEEPEVRTEREVVRVVVPAEQSRALQDEVESLKQQLAEREQELERIRRTLTRDRN